MSDSIKDRFLEESALSVDDLDLEKVSGGRIRLLTCPKCGQQIPLSAFNAHLKTCGKG